MRSMWQRFGIGDESDPRGSSDRLRDREQEVSPPPASLSSLSSSSPKSPPRNPDQQDGMTQQHSPDEEVLTFREKISNSLGSYITIEAVWQITLFAACYRYRPLVRLGRSERGQKFLHNLQTTLFGTNNTNKVPSAIGTGGDASSQVFAKRLRSLGICSSSLVKHIPGGSRTLLATSEWFFFNKVIGIPLWPTKILLAGWITNKLQEHHMIQKRQTNRRATTSSTETTSSDQIQYNDHGSVSNAQY